MEPDIIYNNLMWNLANLVLMAVTAWCKCLKLHLIHYPLLVKAAPEKRKNFIQLEGLLLSKPTTT